MQEERLVESANVPYLSPVEVAEKLGCSINTVGRAARRAALGVYTHGGKKLAALHPNELARLRTHVHATSGNPVWIAAKRPTKRR
jgi:hypothetical protein